MRLLLDGNKTLSRSAFKTKKMTDGPAQLELWTVARKLCNGFLIVYHILVLLAAGLETRLNNY